MSTFYIWNPNIVPNQINALDFVLTNSNVNGIALDKAFAESILKDISVEANVTAWTPVPYRSNYYSEYIDEEDWRDIWQVVWKVRVETSSKINTLQPHSLVSWIPTDAIGEEWLDKPDGEPVGCLAISDFDSEAMLQKAQAKIANNALLKKMREQYLVGEPIFSRSEILGQYQQLQIDLGKFEDSFFQKGADYAELVLKLCKQMGGTVHFEDRSL